MKKIDKNLFKQILETIRSIRTNQTNNSEELKRKFVELKKKFYILRQNQRNSDGKVEENLINVLLAELLELRSEGHENEENINEVLQIIAEEIREQGDLERTKKIHTQILGYEGTRCDNMHPAYIREIICKKIEQSKEKTIGKDIVNMLLECFNSIDLTNNLSHYKTLIDDVIIPLTSGDNEELTDKRILTVLTKLSKEWKVQGKYQEALELCSRGQKLKQFLDTEEYCELLKEHESLRLYLSLEKNFRTVQIDMTNKTLIEAIREALGKNGVIDVETGGGDIFLKGTRDAWGDEPKTGIAYRMPTEEKLGAIDKLLKEIQKEIPTATVTEIKVNTDGTFKGYVIIPITNTNITVLENMNDDVNEAIYLVDNSEIEKIVGKMTKIQARQQDGVESANHSADYLSYTERLISKAKKLLEYPEKKAKREGVVRKSKEWYDRFKAPKRKRKSINKGEYYE